MWIKDKFQNTTLIINSKKIENNFLKGNFITEFDEEFNVKRNIKSEKIDITLNEWKIYDAKYMRKMNIKILQS